MASEPRWDRMLRKPQDDVGAALTDKQRGPRDPKAFREGILGAFAASKLEKKPYEWQTGKFNLTILPGVFSPKYFTDSLWFAERLPRIVTDGSFLEMGTGTGIGALYCADAGATVDATDLNETASRNAALNARKFGLQISVYNGNMFEPVAGKKYDFIFWNHPFNPWRDAPRDVLHKAGVDPNYGDLRRYVGEGRNHLTGNGGLLLGTSDMADQKEIEKIAAENKYRLTLLEEGEIPISEGSSVLNTLLMYRFDPK